MATIGPFVQCLDGKPSKKGLSIIRRHTMNVVVEERKRKGRRGRSKKHNTLQLPPDIRDDDSPALPATDDSSVHEDERAHTSLRRVKKTSHIAKSLPIDGIFELMSELGLDLSDLSALTTVHIGSHASPILTSKPNLLARILSTRQPSFLNYAYSRFNHVEVVRDAVVCLLVKARSTLSSDGQPGKTSDQERAAWNARRIPLLYSRALRTLQAVLATEDWNRTEVLCAIQLLALFELLENSFGASWSTHIAGAAHVLCLRGPQSYESDFDRALFMALIGPILCEAFFNDTLCFLSLPPWRATLSRFITKYTSAAIEHGLLWTSIPTLTYHTTRLVCPVQDTKMESQQIERGSKQLLRELYVLKTKIHAWKIQYGSGAFEDPLQPISGLIIQRTMETIGGMLCIMCITNRLIMSLQPCLALEVPKKLDGNGEVVPVDPAEIEGEDLEAETLRHAKQMIRVLGMAEDLNHSAGFYAGQKVGIAEAVIHTTDEWRAYAEWRQQDLEAEQTDWGKPLDKRLFEKWCDLMGRKIC